MGWITALKAPAIAALARDGGPLQMSLLDTWNLAEITHPDYPGERLICCHNPALGAGRARTREELLAATGKDLAKIKGSVGAGRLKDPDKIGIRVGKVIGKRKAGKHFITDIAAGRFTYRRDEEKITAEAAFDGIYVIRTGVTAGTPGPAAVVTAYKNLKHAGRDFRITKADGPGPAAHLPLPRRPGPRPRPDLHARLLPRLAPAPGPIKGRPGKRGGSSADDQPVDAVADHDCPTHDQHPDEYLVAVRTQPAVKSRHAACRHARRDQIEQKGQPH
jgi:hypothetical protein